MIFKEIYYICNRGGFEHMGSEAYIIERVSVYTLWVSSLSKHGL